MTICSCWDQRSGSDTHQHFCSLNLFHSVNPMQWTVDRITWTCGIKLQCMEVELKLREGWLVIMTGLAWQVDSYCLLPVVYLCVSEIVKHKMSTIKCSLFTIKTSKCMHLCPLTEWRCFISYHGDGVGSVCVCRLKKHWNQFSEGHRGY